MPRYKVSFSRRWITGRWRFTDRAIHGIGGQPSERSGLQNAWLVEYGGSSAELGGYLTEELKLERSKDARPGAVFEIEELEPRPPPPRSRRASRPRLAPPPPWRAGG